MRPPVDQLTEELLVALLADAPEDYLGADALCGKLGLPRTVVFRQIDQLRSKGYRIDLRPAQGYRLMAVPDRLTALELSPLLDTEELGRTVHAFDSVESTNDVARALAEDGAGHGELVITESQTKGRGRRGRTWLSPPGKNLTFSLVLRPNLPLDRVAELTLAAGVAVTEVLRSAAFNAQLKWPNDVLIGGLKVAGILTETAVEEGILRYAILGIGLNVNVDPLPVELAGVATSLQAVRGEAVPRALLLSALLGRLESWIEQIQGQGFAGVLDRCRTWSATLGRRVHLEGPPVVEGMAESIEADGALLVRSDAGTVQRVVAGDVGLV